MPTKDKRESLERKDRTRKADASPDVRAFRCIVNDRKWMFQHPYDENARAQWRRVKRSPDEDTTASEQE